METSSPTWTETSNQLQALTGAFADSLKSAIATQESQLSQQFAELKDLIQSSANANSSSSPPQKKPKKGNNGDDCNLSLDSHPSHCMKTRVFQSQYILILLAGHLSEVNSDGFSCRYDSSQIWCLYYFHVQVLPSSAFCLFFSSARFNQFAMFFAVRVGQASNPGPNSEGIPLAVCNPTAAHKKVDLLLNFEAQIIAASETSVTNIIQKQVTYEMGLKGYKSFWSLPVAPKKNTVGNRPSFRGEALGSAVFPLCHAVK